MRFPCVVWKGFPAFPALPRPGRGAGTLLPSAQRLVWAPGRPGTPSRPRRGIASPVAIRRGEGAQMKRCRDPRCSPRGNPACRGTSGGRRKAVRDRLALQGAVTSPTLPQPAPARARTLEAGKRWARLAQARAASRPGGVSKSRTQLSNFTFTFHFSLSCFGQGNGNPLQCSCLENPRNCGAWWAAVYGVAQSRLSPILSSSLPKGIARPEG